MSVGAPRKIAPFELFKSVLVIPLVVAIVMGAAWGLVHWATLRQAESGKPDPRPAERAADGSLVLQVPFAQVTGEIRYGGGARPMLGNWKHADETVSWRFPVDKGGRYAVELDCACDAANAGSTVRVDVAATKTEITIPDTGGGGRDKFKTVRGGDVSIETPGWIDLRITPVKIAHESVMILRGVRLVPEKS